MNGTSLHSVDMDALRAELATVERKLAALNTKSDFDPNADFALKTEIGGIRSESRRVKRRRGERWDDQARDHAALMERKQVLEARLAQAQAAPRRAAAEATVDTILRATLRVGDPVTVAGFPDDAVVTRLNAKSVSVRFLSGYTERVSWSVVRTVERAEWERMVAEWQAANPAETEEGEV